VTAIPTCAVRTLSLLVVLASLTAELPGASLLAGAQPQVGLPDAGRRASAQPPPVLDATAGDAEARIDSLIHRWFARLADPSSDANSLGEFVAEPTFALVLDGASIHDRPALLAWFSELRALYPTLEYRIDPIRIHEESRTVYRAVFELDRRAIDEAGLPHVARRKHSWLVQVDPIGEPVILEIEEQPLLFSSETGPKIVCY